MTNEDGTTDRTERSEEGTANLPRVTSRLKPRLPSWAVDELRAHPGRLAAIILVAFLAFVVSGVVAWSQRPVPVRAAPSSSPTQAVTRTQIAPQPGWPSGSPSYLETPGLPSTTEATRSARPSASPSRSKPSTSPRPKPTPKPTPRPSSSPTPTSSEDASSKDEGGLATP